MPFKQDTNPGKRQSLQVGKVKLKENVWQAARDDFAVLKSGTLSMYAM